MGYENETAGDLRDVLRLNGFVRCDIAACNCGSWHARYGLQERWSEVKEALASAGHPLCNENGHLVSMALAGLIAERDAAREALADLFALVEGECPSLLNEDSGGDSGLGIRIEDILDYEND